MSDSDAQMRVEKGQHCRATGKNGLPVLFSTVNELESMAGKERRGYCMEEVERGGRRTYALLAHHGARPSEELHIC